MSFESFSINGNSPQVTSGNGTNLRKLENIYGVGSRSDYYKEINKTLLLLTKIDFFFSTQHVLEATIKRALKQTINIVGSL